uniref:uncharacterized protein LOC122583509 n=1 Tax=Erigeron canadensis TaxID=72917 RepID=UPI001CB92AFD|nr:uncharacterized protein LOC122583509 [Erigeron canadensis]
MSTSSSASEEYNFLTNTVTQMNTLFNPEIASVAFELCNEEESNDNTSSSRVPRTRRVLSRDHTGSAVRLWNDYFSDAPTFSADYFRRRFRMRKHMFIRICQAIHSFSAIEPLPKHFQVFQKNQTDCTGRHGFNIFQKCTSAIRQLAYGANPDQLDEYLHMGRATSMECLNNFCKCVYYLYHNEYLRKPISEDVQRLVSKHEQVHGFPGMLGSIDCMHWGWRNCPVAWQGQYTRGDKGHPTIMLEAVASYDLWIWHASFGPAGSNNDINMLNESDLFKDRAPALQYTVNGEEFTKGYYLADGIYPEWATLVKSFKCPMDSKSGKFKRYQEAARKDVKRAFGVLQGRWAILKHNARPFSVNKIKRIMYACVILHNMIVQDNGNAISDFEEDYLSDPTNVPTRTWDERVATQMRAFGELRDRRTHHRLRTALVEHVWNLPENYRQR